MLPIDLLRWLVTGQSVQPVENQPVSYWQSPPSDIANLGTAEDLPSETLDYVVIGSGLTGSTICFELLQGAKEGEKPSVALMEARQLCSGATGRNGGHMLVQSFLELYSGMRKFGFKAALARYNFTRQNCAELQRYIEENNLADEVGYRNEKRVEVFFDPTRWAEVTKAYDEVKEHGVDLSETEVYKGLAADEVARTTGAVGAFFLPGAVFWPYKFVTHLIKRSVSLGLKCYANTPVIQVARNLESGISTVQTTRGPVYARNVIFATNAYVSQLVPELHAGVLPVRGHVVALKPEGGLAKKALRGPHILVAGESVYDAHEYMHQRIENGKPASIVIGGGMFSGDQLEIATQDDSKIDPKIGHRLRKEIPLLFRHEWNQDGVASLEAEASHEWSGIQGITWDRIPHVGPLTTPGHYVAAAFSGNGMSWCWLTGKCLVKMIRNEPLSVNAALVFNDPKTVGLWNSLKKLVLGAYN